MGLVIITLSSHKVSVAACLFMNQSTCQTWEAVRDGGRRPSGAFRSAGRAGAAGGGGTRGGLVRPPRRVTRRSWWGSGPGAGPPGEEAGPAVRFPWSGRVQLPRIPDRRRYCSRRKVFREKAPMLYGNTPSEIVPAFVPLPLCEVFGALGTAGGVSAYFPRSSVAVRIIDDLGVNRLSPVVFVIGRPREETGKGPGAFPAGRRTGWPRKWNVWSGWCVRGHGRRPEWGAAGARERSRGVLLPRPHRGSGPGGRWSGSW
ncbi:hypothetical protein EV190_103166 [Actinorugispora endophytica]|uniref:Uncharacterized protein n=1 Tax=Actinorugispora endophytica TaxID=1605990 RepID=A0A4R6V107_9ACTN|nr:hypothetical protein EV190_103166 [Actinorugispora endophytica]